MSWSDHAPPAVPGSPLISPAQTEIWYLQQRRPASPCCWIGEFLDIAGPIDPARFTEALRRAVAAIPALHAGFAETPDGPRQHHRRPVWVLPIEDVSAAAEPIAEAQARMQAILDRQPGLSGDALFAFALYQVGPARWLWFQGYHHIVMDGAGAHRVAVTLARIYAASGTGVPPPTLRQDRPPLRAAFDAAAGDHWRALLADWNGPIRLGGRSAEPADRALRCPVPLPPADITRLRAAAAEHRIALSTLLTAAVALWTNGLSGASDVVLGIAVRDRAARLPAMLSNVVPLRVAIGPDSTALSLARTIVRQRRAGRLHQGYRGERVLRALAPLDARSFGPTVNVMPFDYGITFDAAPVTAHNLSIGPIDDLCVTIYDRRIGDDCAPDPDLRIDLDANPTVHGAARLSDFASRLARLLESLAADITQPAAVMDLLSPEERRQHLQDWNSTDHPLAPTGIAELFLRHARADPAAPCINHAGAASDYGTIDRDSGMIALRLLQDGIGPGAIVAILLPRSAAFLTVLLAIARTGAAFLPLDPGNPADRLAMMLADARPACTVTTTLHAAMLPPDHPALCLDDRATLLSLASLYGQQAGSDPPPTDPKALAYAIFTSGTTGRPKAVLVANRGIASLAAFQVVHLGLGAASRVLQFAAVGFDAVVMEILMAFASGACLYIPMEPERHGAALGAFLSRHHITHALLPPVTLAGLDAATQHAPHTLIVGGEACPPALAAAWSTGHRMINAYGPTEATICATMSDPLSPGPPPSIGRPIWNTRIYVLDQFDRPVPAWKANCTSPAMAWRSVISATRPRPLRVSWPARSGRASTCCAPAIAPDSAPMAASTAWAEPTAR